MVGMSRCVAGAVRSPKYHYFLFSIYADSELEGGYAFVLDGTSHWVDFAGRVVATRLPAPDGSGIPADWLLAEPEYDDTRTDGAMALGTAAVQGSASLDHKRYDDDDDDDVCVWLCACDGTLTSVAVACA
jgi:hypothetical protein